MLFDCQAFEYGIKLWAVSDLFSGFYEAWIGCHIETVYCDLSLRGLDFTCQAFEAVGFSCTRNSEKSEAFSILKAEGHFFNSRNFTISFSDVVYSYRKLIFVKILDSLLFNADPFVLTKMIPKDFAIFVRLFIDLLSAWAAEAFILDANEKEYENRDAAAQAIKVWSSEWLIVWRKVIFLEFVKLEFHELDWNTIGYADVSLHKWENRHWNQDKSDVLC